MEKEKFYALKDSYIKSLMQNLAKNPQDKESLDSLCETLEIEPKDVYIGDFYKKQNEVKGEFYDFPYTVAIGKINAGELNMNAPNLKYVEGDLTGGFDDCKTILTSLEIVDGDFWLENNTPNKLPHIRKITGDFSGNIYNIPEELKELEECGSVTLFTTTDPDDRRSTGKITFEEFKEKEEDFKTLFPQITFENSKNLKNDNPSL